MTRVDIPTAALRKVGPLGTDGGLRLACECGRVLAFLHGNGGQLHDVKSRGRAAVDVTDPEAVDRLMAGIREGLAPDDLPDPGRWSFECPRPRCRGPKVRRMGVLAKAYASAKRAGRTELVLDVDL